MNVNLYVIEDYENEPPSGPKKQTQSKPISMPIKPSFRQEMPKMPYLPALFYLRIYDINLRPFFSIKIKEAIFRNDQSKRS